jgi:DNA topoisomerase-3
MVNNLTTDSTKKITNLIVITTEKPSVAREYANVLHVSGKNNGYIEGYSDVMDSWIKITWCVGHLCTLSYPEAYDEGLKNWSMDTLPFLPEKYKYEIIKDVSSQFNVVKECLLSIGTEKEKARIEEELKKIGKASSINDFFPRILYAGDAGREGLYIQMLVRQMAGRRGGEVDERIVWIDSYTESEILRGIACAKPIREYTDQIKAAYMRAIEDYMLGINFSRALTIKYGYAYRSKAGIDKGSIAVGRVMTCVLAMIVEREREISAFKETPFFKILGKSSPDISALWKAVETSHYHESPLLYDETGFKTGEEAEKLCAILNADKKVTITDYKKSEEKKNAPLLFNLAELQNFCSEKYKISPDKTLEIAQSLYEKKLTTYPRTDARVLSTAVAREVGKTLNGLVKLGYKQDVFKTVAMNKWHIGFENNKRYVDDSKIQDHYAIIPTGFINGAENLSELEKCVYLNIIDRFLSVFYPAAIYTKIESEFTHSSGEKLYSKTKALKEPGYLTVVGIEDEDKKAFNTGLASLKKGDSVNMEFELKEGKTTPPKRYTSGSMIIAMENAGKLIEDEELRAQIKGAGIGTSATRAATIKKLITTSMIRLNPKTQILSPMLPGECVYDIVKDTIPELLRPEMTASWEKGLSQIETGEVTYDRYKSTLEQYVANIVARIKSKEESGMGSYSDEVSLDGIKCPVCGKGTIKENSKAYGCSEYKSGCTFVIWKTIGEKTLSPKHVKELLTKGKTGIIKGFVSKSSGKKFDAHLVYKEGKIEYYFPNRKKKSS